MRIAVERTRFATGEKYDIGYGPKGILFSDERI